MSKHERKAGQKRARTNARKLAARFARATRDGLTEAQDDGRACVSCGAEGSAMVPTGARGSRGAQLFECERHRNMRDMKAKGRARGNPAPRRKLSTETASAMRSMRHAGASVRAIARAFGVSTSLSAMVLRGERWTVERAPEVG